MTATIEDRLVIGDASVLKEIYAHHGSLIHTIAYQLQGPAADQFTISTFVEAWRHRRDFDPSKGTVQAWLIRRLRSQLSNNEDYAAEVIDRVVVTASLARMESTRREILLAGAATDTGATTELAQRLNLPVGTVKAHLRRGMETLQYDLADSRSDGDASSLVDIVRSRRLETEVVQPDPAVWDAIRTATEADAEVEGQGSVDDGVERPGRVPVIPDPFGTLRDDPIGPTPDRRRPPVEVEVEGTEPVGDDAPLPGAPVPDGEKVAADESGPESDAGVVETAGVNVDDAEFPISAPAGVTTELDDVPPALRMPESPLTMGSDDDPTLVYDDSDDEMDVVADTESATDDSPVDAEDLTVGLAQDLTVGLDDDGPERSVLEPSDEGLAEDQDESADFALPDSPEPGPGPMTETDFAIARMRPALEDPVRPLPHRTLTIAGVVAALVVLLVLFLIVL